MILFGTLVIAYLGGKKRKGALLTIAAVSAYMDNVCFICKPDPNYVVHSSISTTSFVVFLSLCIFHYSVDPSSNSFHENK